MAIDAEVLDGLRELGTIGFTNYIVDAAEHYVTFTSGKWTVTYRYNPRTEKERYSIWNDEVYLPYDDCSGHGNTPLEALKDWTKLVKELIAETKRELVSWEYHFNSATDAIKDGNDEQD